MSIKSKLIVLILLLLTKFRYVVNVISVEILLQIIDTVDLDLLEKST